MRLSRQHVATSPLRKSRGWMRMCSSSVRPGTLSGPIWSICIRPQPARCWTTAIPLAGPGLPDGSDDLHRTDADTVYGVEIEAALVETLLQQRAPRVVGPEGNALAALLVGLLTAVVGLALERRRWPIALVVPVAAVGMAVALVVAGVLIALLPMLLAAGIGLWISRTPVVTTEQAHP